MGFTSTKNSQRWRVVAVRVTVLAADEDLASGLLWDLGTTGIELRASGHENVALLAYFEPDPGLVERVRCGLNGLAFARVEPVPIPDVDWVASVRERFRAFDVGPFRIQPAWESSRRDPSRPTLIVDPGQAFGTGAHQTTRLCLLALSEAAARGPLGRVLDLGAGSAILAIAAAKLGAGSATATDFDDEAIASARRHASLNDVPLRIVRADGASAFRPAAFDIVVANLSAPLLRERRHEILCSLRAGGLLVLSGFLTGDLPQLRAAYAGVGRATQRSDGEWAALVLRLGARPR